MLQTQEFAQLTNTLQVPATMGQILRGEERFSDDIEYGLHEVISNMQPDTALLAIAVSAKTITAAHNVKNIPALNVLEMECDRIIEEYGEVWVQNAQNQPVDEDRIFDVLINTAEDLESLAELINTACSMLRGARNNAPHLCDILYVQATSHALIAEAYMEAADQAVEQYTEELSANARMSQSNVIQFPIVRSA